MARRIYWRVTYTSGATYPAREEEVSGVFTDLSTPRGAAARLRRSTGRVWVHQNGRLGSFAPENYCWDDTRGCPNYEVLAGDFDGDGYADLVERNVFTGEFTVYRNARHGGGDCFEAGQVIGGARSVVGTDWRVMVADFTGDGRVDFADHHVPSGWFWIHANLGGALDAANWGWHQTKVTGADWRQVVGDFTGDGLADYADLQTSSGWFWIHRNRGERGGLPPGGNAFDGADWRIGRATGGSDWRLLVSYRSVRKTGRTQQRKRNPPSDFAPEGVS